MILEQKPPHDPAAFVLLYIKLICLCKSIGQRSYLQKEMKERDLVKEAAGSSWLARGGKQSAQVSRRWHLVPESDPDLRRAPPIGVEIKELGYVPNTDFVLHDVEKEEKEKYSWQHSEKIAVAYGFIS